MVFSWKILDAMGSFEKWNDAMLGELYSQHVTGNMSRLDQSQIAIILNKYYTLGQDVVNVF